MGLPNGKPRILIIGPGPSDVGGVATFIEFIVSSSYLRRNLNIAHMDTSRGLRNQATAGRFSGRNLSSFIRQVFQLLAILMRSKPRIVHLNVTAGLSFWKTMVFMLLIRAFRARMIAHIHGGNFHEFFEGSRVAARRLIAWTLGQADVVVVLSGWWKNYIQNIVKPGVRVLAIPNAPEQSLFSRPSGEQPQESRSGNTLLFVGSIGKRKGIFDILNAIPLVTRECSLARFIFLGEEEIAGEKQQVLLACKQHNLHEFVSFLGWVVGEEKKKHYERADVFLLPSHAENLPFALLEAMAMGLPVVSTPVGGIPEVIEDGREGYLIEPGDEQALAERIVRLLKEPQLRKTMGANARRRVQEQFSPERIAKQWESLYMELVGGGGQAQHVVTAA
jgi:glycosyltransferase involved in cell wall biosynthesis